MTTPDPTPTPLPAAPDWRALCQELRDAYFSHEDHPGNNPHSDDLIVRVDATLATPPAAPDTTREQVKAAIADALGGGAYDCLRVWSAWNCGTMGADDFSPIAEDDDRVAEIADAAIAALATPTPTAPDWRALCQELLQAIYATDDWLRFDAAVDRARTALATPPAVDADERLRLVTAGICSGYIAGHDATVEGHYGDPEEVAAETAPMVLAELGATPPAATREAGPLPQSGAVSERLQGVAVDGVPCDFIRTMLRPAYEPGDGSADGAQLVSQAWWHPIMGCDSLQIVVDNARAVLARWGGAAVQPKTAPTEEDIEDLAEVFNGDAVPAIRRALELWGGAVVQPVAAADGRDPACVAQWPDCQDGAYDPRCCRFPKSCSCGPQQHAAAAGGVK